MTRRTRHVNSLYFHPLWLRRLGKEYLPIRKDCHGVQRLPVSAEHRVAVSYFGIST